MWPYQQETAVWSNLLKKSYMENSIFRAVNVVIIYVIVSSIVWFLLCSFLSEEEFLNFTIPVTLPACHLTVCVFM